jgi:hypothetical protein
MKYLVFCLLLTLTACGSSSSLSDESVQSDLEKSKNSLEVYVSNNFTKVLDENNENELHVFREVVTKKTRVKIPHYISTTKGVSGFRWLTLDVGDKQFCYQGNGFPGGEMAKGDSFILRGVQDINSSPCYERKFKEVYDDSLELKIGDIISSKIHGKVCIYFCEKLEAQFSITYLSY